MSFKTVSMKNLIVDRNGVDEAHVVKLKESIGVGLLLHPITVNKKGRVLMGRHRYWAAHDLGHKKVDVHEIDVDERTEQLLMLDENLARRAYDALQLGEMWKARKIVYEKLHADASKRGGDQSKARRSRSATDHISEKSGLAQRTIQEHISAVERIDPKVRAVIAETPAAKSITDLTALAKLETSDQIAVAARVAKTGEKVKQAVKALKRAEQVELAKAYMPPAGEYAVIAVDFPWKYEDAQDGKGMERGLPYPPMTIEEICAFIDEKLKPTEDCALFCWVTNPILLDQQCWAVVYAKLRTRWGFVAKQIRTWTKTNDDDEAVTKQGWVWRNDTEHLVRLERGRPVFNPTGEKHGTPIQRTSFRAPIGEHSEKPAVAYTDIEALCASTSRLEMFARAERAGWATTGSELPATEPKAATIAWREHKGERRGKGPSGREYTVNGMAGCFMVRQHAFALSRTLKGQGGAGPFTTIEEAHAWAEKQEARELPGLREDATKLEQLMETRTVRAPSESLGDLTGTKFGEQLAKHAGKVEAKKRRKHRIVYVDETEAA